MTKSQLKKYVIHALMFAIVFALISLFAQFVWGKWSNVGYTVAAC